MDKKRKKKKIKSLFTRYLVTWSETWHGPGNIYIGIQRSSTQKWNKMDSFKHLKYLFRFISGTWINLNIYSNLPIFLVGRKTSWTGPPPISAYSRNTSLGCRKTQGPPSSTHHQIGQVLWIVTIWITKLFFPTEFEVITPKL